MFASVGRKLAVLNVLVVIAVVAAIGLGTFLLLRQSLDREADNALAERISVARIGWTPGIESGQLTLATPAVLGKSKDDSDKHDSDDILKSGDTLLFAFGKDGKLLANERGVSLHDIPVSSGVRHALKGDVDTRIVSAEKERVRVRTEPVFSGSKVVGAIQAVRSEREHDSELRLIRMVSIAGVFIGIAIALPVGLFLAQRAMRPIDVMFRRQRTFIADASHELRTPLTILRANADMVRRMPEPTPTEVHQEMDLMMREIDTMSWLVDDLLNLAQIDTPDARISMVPVDVAQVILAANAAMLSRIKKADLSLQAEVIPATARANDALVEQVLRILIDNAIKYTPPGGLVTVKDKLDGHYVIVTVSDTGSGIDPADQPYVFDRFFRSDRARSGAISGSGLGLPIARSIVRALGGEIHLTSEIEKGTSVSFTLPVARG